MLPTWLILCFVILWLPAAVWLVITAVSFRKTERGTALRRRTGTALAILIAVNVLTVIPTIPLMIEGGFDDFIVLMTITGVFGLPLTAFSLFIAALIRCKRCPKDAPEYPKRRRMLIISAIVSAVLIAASTALIIMFMFAIAHM